jgi:integrase
VLAIIGMRKGKVNRMAKYAPGIYKRGRIFWLCYKNRDNKIVRESAKTEDLAKAEFLLALRRKSVENVGEIEKTVCRSCTFMALADKYRAFAASQKSYYIKKIIINQLAEKFGDIDIEEFTSSLVESYLSDGLKEGLKPATVNRRLACLKHMFRKACEWGNCTEGKLKELRKVKFFRENNQRVRYLEPEECQALVHVCEKYPRLRHLRPIVITAMNTGMRRSEILALKWEQVDLRSGIINLHDASSGEGRQIPINEVLAETLRATVRYFDSPYVFVDSQGKPYRHIREAFASACRRIGVKDFRFQDLRHTFASHLVKAGIEISTVSKLLGHKSMAMTLRYSYLAPDQMKAAVNALNGLSRNSSSFRLNASLDVASTRNEYCSIG